MENKEKRNVFFNKIMENKEKRNIFFDKILNKSKFISNLPKFARMFDNLSCRHNNFESFKKGYQIGYGQGIADFMRENGLNIQTDNNGNIKITNND